MPIEKIQNDAKKKSGRKQPNRKDH